MIIYLAADHGGFRAKEAVKALLIDSGYQTEDVGAASLVEGDDYPDYAASAARKISLAPDQSRGIFFCRSGVGMDIVANKFKGVRSALAISADHVSAARHDEDVNVVCIASNYLSEEQIKKITEIFLTTPFAREEKYERRLTKVMDIEDDAA